METNPGNAILQDSSLPLGTGSRKKVGVFISNTIVGADVFLWTPEVYRNLGKILPQTFWRYFYRFYYGNFTEPYKVVDRFDAPPDAAAYTLLVLMTGELMKTKSELALKRTVQAALYAQNVLGADIICLGSLTKHVTKNGKLLREAGVTKPAITHGDAYSVGCTWLDFKSICRYKGWEEGDWPRTAIIGSGGTIGSALAQIFAKWNVPQLLIARRKDVLQAQIEALRAEYPAAEIWGSDDLMSIKEHGVRVIIPATSDHRVLIHPEHVPLNGIIYEVSQPNNTSPKLVQIRPDIERLDGAFVTEPPYIRRRFGMRLPLGTTYACAAELLIRLRANDFRDHCEDVITIPEVREVLAQAKEAGFAPAPPSSYNRDVTLRRNGKSEGDLEFGKEADPNPGRIKVQVKA